MEGATETVDGPITPYKPGKDDQVIELFWTRLQDGIEYPLKTLELHLSMLPSAGRPEITTSGIEWQTSRAY